MISKLEKETQKAVSVFEKARTRLLNVVGQSEVTIAENEIEKARLTEENANLELVRQNALQKAKKIDEILA